MLSSDYKFMVENYISLTKALTTKEESKSVEESQRKFLENMKKRIGKYKAHKQ